MIAPSETPRSPSCARSSCATGALEQVEQRIAARADDARAALGTSRLSPEARAALDGLIGVAVDRRA